MMVRRWLAIVLLLSGCHADLDWRELRSDEGRFSVWLPARPFQESRPLSGRSEQVLMHQWSARALDTVFAVGYADFPRLEPGTAIEIRDALLANVAGKILKESAISLPGAQGRETIAAGRSGSNPLSLRLRLLVNGDRLYEIATLGKPGAVPEGDLDTFFESFRLLKRDSSSAFQALAQALSISPNSPFADPSSAARKDAARSAARVAPTSGKSTFENLSLIPCLPSGRSGSPGTHSMSFSRSPERALTVTCAGQFRG